jgi:hypothetical protein
MGLGGDAAGTGGDGAEACTMMQLRAGALCQRGGGSPVGAVEGLHVRAHMSDLGAMELVLHLAHVVQGSDQSDQLDWSGGC